MDLVDEMQWEDTIDASRMLSLEDAGLVESSNDEPLFGYHTSKGSAGSIYSYTAWFYDNDYSAFEVL